MRIVSFYPNPLPAPLAEGLSGIAEVVFWSELTEEQKQSLQDVQIVVTSPTVKMDKALFDLLPNLKMAASLGVGFDKVDLEEVKRRGIVFANAPTATSDDVADFVWALLCALSRQIPQAFDHAREKLRTFSGFPLSRRITGKKLGVAGLGHIGREIARRAEGFKMAIGYTDLKAHEGKYQKFENLTDLARWCDYLVLAMPGGASTHHIASKEVLEALGGEGFLINIGRGELIDTNALIEALKEKRIAGAAIDVFEGEPAINPELCGIDNLIITPHVASSTFEARDSVGEQALENIQAFLATGTAPNKII